MSATANCASCGRLDLAELLDADRRCAGCVDPRSRRARIEQLVFNRVGRSGLPASIRNVPLPDTEGGELARAWAGGEIPVLVLTGRPGRGKTWLAAAAAREALKHRQVRWIAAAQSVHRIDGSFGDRDRADALAALNGEDSIVLDDLDKACDYERQVSRIFTAIDSRIAAGSPLLVTMNCTPAQLGRLVDSRDRHERTRGMAITSRLNGGVVVELGGPDRRRRA
ncbi:MAG TPA: ATP-binding protein [Solirubrobacterales bacterium]|nr:ATP-binding protein [Solirubrobacterales bacterium]